VIVVDLYNRIREMNVVEGFSQREVAKLLGVSRNIVRKYWNGEVVPGNCAPATVRRTLSKNGHQS